MIKSKTMEPFVKELDGALIRITAQENGSYYVEFEDRTSKVIDVELDADQDPRWFFHDRQDDETAALIGLLIEDHQE